MSKPKTSTSEPKYYIKNGSGKAKLYSLYGMELSTVLVNQIPEGLEDKTVYTIELNQIQLELIWKYLETMTRINAMQLEEAVDGMMENICSRGQIVKHSQAYFEKRTELKEAFEKVLSVAGFKNGESLGIGQVSKQDQICYEMYKTIGHAVYNIDGLADTNKFSVYSSNSLNYSGEKLINVEVKKNEYDKE